MEHRAWVVTMVIVSASCGLGSGACAPVAEGAAGEWLVFDAPGDPTVHHPGTGEPSPSFDGGITPLLTPPENRIDAVFVRRAQRPSILADDIVDCGKCDCDENERCCHVTARCYPIDCQDCCEAELHPPAEEPRALPDIPEPVD